MAEIDPKASPSAGSPVPYTGDPEFAELPLEERIEKGMQAYREGTISSIHEAARRYGIPFTTFYYRLKNVRRNIKVAATTRQKITAADEALICQHITQRLEIGFPFESNMLHETAETLYRRKCRDAGVEFKPVGLNWCGRFLRRHPDFRKTWEYYREKSREERREAAKARPPTSVSRGGSGPLNTQGNEQSATADSPDPTPNPAPKRKRRKKNVQSQPPQSSPPGPSLPPASSVLQELPQHPLPLTHWNVSHGSNGTLGGFPLEGHHASYQQTWQQST